MRAALLALVLALGCTEPAGPPAPTFRVWWAAATGPRAGLPPDVDGLTITVLDPEGEPAEREMNVQRDDLTDDTPFAVVGGLPAGRAVEVRIEARVGARVAYTGVVGPFVLGPGERRYVDLLLVPTDTVTEVGRLAEPVAMHTATTLADGRILFAGGFRAADEVPCLDQPAASRCFDLTATTGALLYDPASGRSFAVRNSLSTPRAAHTATLLADGRVLLAGGVSAAQLALVAQDDGGLIPVLSVDPLAAVATTDIFDPTRFREDQDVGGDGDAGRGGFDEGPPMASPRAQHTASLLPSGTAVLVAGGDGGEQTSELFDGAAWSDAGALAVGRHAHVAFTVTSAGQVWLVGGAIDADAEVDVAEVFTLAEDGVSGAWGPPPDLELPVGGPEAAASINLVGAGVALLGDRTAVVFGWIGALCSVDGDPTFSGIPCAPDNRAFALDVLAARIAQPVGRDGERHAMGSVISTPDGGAFAIGGFADDVPATTAAIERLTGVVDVGTVQPEVDGSSLELGEGRALLSGASQTDGAVVVSGGLTVEPAGVRFSDLLEVVDPAR